MARAASCRRETRMTRRRTRTHAPTASALLRPHDLGASKMNAMALGACRRAQRASIFGCTILVAGAQLGWASSAVAIFGLLSCTSWLLTCHRITGRLLRHRLPSAQFTSPTASPHSCVLIDPTRAVPFPWNRPHAVVFLVNDRSVARPRASSSLSQIRPTDPSGGFARSCAVTVVGGVRHGPLW